jgi:hypothetical protein
MRNLSAAALAQIAEKLGGEPIYIIDIQWAREGSVQRYADRDIPNESIKGQILQVGELDAVTSSRADSQALSVVLDDEDGAIKAIMDTNDIHKRDAWVYQWFEGLDISDAFLLFRGQISSPLTWNEGDRTVSFSILSQIEDKELGFSPEEGEFTYISNELIGEPWPLCFGTTTYSKTLKLTNPSVGITADGVAMADPALRARMDALQLQIDLFKGQESQSTFAAATIWLDVPFGEDPTPAQQAEIDEHYRIASDAHNSWVRRQDEYNTLEPKYNEQLATQKSSFQMFNAKHFPTGPVTIQIGQLQLVGSINPTSEIFTITSRIHPKIQADPEAELPWCDGFYSDHGFGDFDDYRGQDNGHPAWQALPWTKGDHNWGYIYENPGSQVFLVDNEPQTYIVSLVPGTVLNVSTMLQQGGQKYLASVADWSQATETFGSISAVVVYLPDALSKNQEAGYSDEIYVTFESSVGPNTVDILEWTIQQYTEFNIDAASFANVRARVDDYPSNFTIQRRINVLEFLHEVAWQARCQLRLVNDTFYLSYLPEVPASAATITESDIDVGSFEIEHTPTEDLVTKMICNWWATGAQEESNRVIMRHNVAKYGIQEQTYDFYIYDNIDMVLKSATFWLIRNANTWKVARFTTPLNLLNVETEDGVTLSFTTPYISNDDITALVEEATYNSEDRSIQFQCWTGVKAGQMEQYDFAFPADVDSTLTFPTPEEIAAGLDGGYGNNKAATGELGTEALESRIKKVEYTFNASGSRRYQDKGLEKPSDIGDVNPGAPIPDDVPILSVATPGPISGQLYIAETEATTAASSVSEGITQIDLHTTEIFDSETGLSCTLNTFFNKIALGEGTEEPVLHGNTNAIWSNASETTGYPFLFQVDTNLTIYGAGLAFLYEDE